MVSQPSSDLFTLQLSNFLTPEVKNLRHPVARETRDHAKKLAISAGGEVTSCTVYRGEIFFTVKGEDAVAAIEREFIVDGSKVTRLTRAQAIRAKLHMNHNNLADNEAA